MSRVNCEPALVFLRFEFVGQGDLAVRAAEDGLCLCGNTHPVALGATPLFRGEFAHSSRGGADEGGGEV